MASRSPSEGGLIILDSYKMYKQPKNKLCGVLIILWSLTGLFYIGGFGLGGILDLIGEILGLGYGKR